MSEEESFVCVCEREKDIHSIVKHIAPVFYHGIRVILALERNPSCRVTILQVNFGGLLVGIRRCGATTLFFQKSIGIAISCFEDQVVLIILAFWFAAIRATHWEIRQFEGNPTEIAKSAEFTFLSK